MTYQSKLLVVLCTLCILPTVLIGWLSYQKSVESLERKVVDDLQVIVGQLNNTIATQVEGFDHFSTLPYSTEEMIDIIGSSSAPTEQWDLTELGKQQRLIELITSYPSINTMIEAILFYGTDGSVYGYRINGVKSIDKSSNPREEHWFKNAIERKGGLVISGLRKENQFNGEPFETLTVARMLVNRDYEPVAVIAVDVKPEFIDKTVRSLGYKNVHVTVTGTYGFVYSNQPSKSGKLLGVAKVTDSADSEIVPIAVDATINGMQESWRGVKKYNEYTGWTTYLMVDRKEFLQESEVIKKFSTLVVFFICIASVLLSWLLARGLAKPIKSLIRSMRGIERGQFLLPDTPVNGRKDEFGQLLLSYNRMVKYLDELVHSIGESERQKREAELNAMRARITPHFLHNTINSIRMLAMLQRSDQIAALLRSLSRLINSNMQLDRELVTLQEEIEFLKDYLQLMDLRYTGKFTIDWEMEDGVMGAHIPAMILQPLVENAIFHGCGNIDDKMRIVIGCKQVKDGSHLEIVIQDDGQGIDPELLQKINSDTEYEKTRNIGIRNVRDRVRLRFGFQYGLELDSVPGKGTTAKLIIPLIKEGE
ncbi:sensor histidine kinase [Paenibacillus puldeungensis]|uniref:Sensor histidine kinase n=1 Tax=Paenibacillus puldeungensis TaxID=696536 RepID=A0ABW3RX18_9BACL